MKAILAPKKPFKRLAVATCACTVLSVASTLCIAQPTAPNQPLEPTKTTAQKHRQAVKIPGVTYATAMRLGLPAPVLIRAKALQQKLTSTARKP